MRLLYSIIYAIVLVFVLPFEYMKRPRGVRKRWLGEKFGRIDTASWGASGDGPTIWVHAVSVGEVLAADVFIKGLKKKNPQCRIAVSTITDTGRMVAEYCFKGGVADTFYVPFDLRFALKKVISLIKPELLVIIETELWPNLIWSAKDEGVPVAVLNGRMSASSFKGYGKLGFFMKRLLGSVDAFLMQDEEYTGRITALGADPARVQDGGSFKFDADLQSSLPQWPATITGPVIVAGSTHGGEEELLVSAYIRLRDDFQDLNLIIAPRHPERFDEVESVMKKYNLPYVRKTRLAGGDISGTMVLLDTIGELGGVYGLADIAVMGGSFIPHGGQNPLEPAFWGKTVVCGPHMENFPFIREFFKAKAAVPSTAETLCQVLRELLESEDTRRVIGGNAKALMESNKGAVDKAVSLVERLLGGAI